jgi:hypothetical protein
MPVDRSTGATVLLSILAGLTAARGPPFWQSRVLRRRYGEAADAGQA